MEHKVHAASGDICSVKERIEMLEAVINKLCPSKVDHPASGSEPQQLVAADSDRPSSVVADMAGTTYPLVPST